MLTILKSHTGMQRIAHFKTAGKTGCDPFITKATSDNGNYGQKVSYLRTKLSNLRLICAFICSLLSLSRVFPHLFLSLFSCHRSPASLCAICDTRITIGSRKLDGRPSSDFAALTYKTTTCEVNYILPTTPGLYADRDNKTSRFARSHATLFSSLPL